MSKLQLDGWRRVASVQAGLGQAYFVEILIAQNSSTFRAAIRSSDRNEIVSARDGTARGALGIAKVRATAAGLGGLHLEAAVSEIEDRLGLEASVTETCAHSVPHNDFCPACGRVVHPGGQP